MRPIASEQSLATQPLYDESRFPAESNGPLGDLDPQSPEFSDALVSLLEEHLSLLQRARQHVIAALKDRYDENGYDLWEWRKVLDTYPLPRLLHFLQSQSPRAARLRRSSPFPAVLSEGEKQRLNELVHRAH
jgi:hypothetical protein